MKTRRIITGMLAAIFMAGYVPAALGQSFSFSFGSEGVSVNVNSPHRHYYYYDDDDDWEDYYKHSRKHYKHYKKHHKKAVKRMKKMHKNRAKAYRAVKKVQLRSMHRPGYHHRMVMYHQPVPRNVGHHYHR